MAFILSEVFRAKNSKLSKKRFSEYQLNKMDLIQTFTSKGFQGNLVTSNKALILNPKTDPPNVDLYSYLFQVKI